MLLQVVSLILTERAPFEHKTAVTNRNPGAAGTTGK